jgi:hypothetical protein
VAHLLGAPTSKQLISSKCKEAQHDMICSPIKLTFLRGMWTAMYPSMLDSNYAFFMPAHMKGKLPPTEGEKSNQHLVIYTYLAKI